MGDREELADLRRLAELEAKAAPKKSGLERFIPGYGIDPASPEGKQMRSDVREKAIDIGMGFGPASFDGGFCKAIRPGNEKRG